MPDDVQVTNEVSLRLMDGEMLDLGLANDMDGNGPNGNDPDSGFLDPSRAVDLGGGNYLYQWRYDASKTPIYAVVRPGKNDLTPGLVGNVAVLLERIGGYAFEIDEPEGCTIYLVDSDGFDRITVDTWWDDELEDMSQAARGRRGNDELIRLRDRWKDEGKLDSLSFAKAEALGDAAVSRRERVMERDRLRALRVDLWQERPQTGSGADEMPWTKAREGALVGLMKRYLDVCDLTMGAVADSNDVGLEKRAMTYLLATAFVNRVVSPDGRPMAELAEGQWDVGEEPRPEILGSAICEAADEAAREEIELAYGEMSAEDARRVCSGLFVLLQEGKTTPGASEVVSMAREARAMEASTGHASLGRGGHHA